MAKRRDHGEGSVFQRERDGKWVARIDLGYQDGHRKRVERIADTKREALEKLKALQKEQEQGIAPEAHRQTLNAFMKDWLEDVKANRSFASYIQYERMWRLHLKPHLGDLPLAKLTPQILQACLRKTQQEKSAPIAKESYIVLQVALNAAVRLRLLPRSPLSAVEKPRHRAAERPIFNAQELQTFLAALDGEKYGAVLLVAVALGLRRSELLGLRWDDVDLDAGTLHVRHALKRSEEGRTLGDPKSRSGKRRLPLPPSVVAALRRHKTAQLQARLFAGDRWEETGHVVTNATGRPLGVEALRRSLLRVIRATGLPSLRLHDLRHCCASYLLSQGLPIKLVSEVIGHSSASITLGIYGHVLEEQKQEAATTMERVLRGGL